MPRTMWSGSASGWLRVILISRSFREPTRAQSVREALEVDFALTPCRLSHGDHVDVIALLGVDEGNNVPSQKPQGHESLLAIGQTVIFIRVRDALEDFFCINEIEPVFVEVHPPFSLMPSDHRESVYTNGICVKGKALRGLPRDDVLSPDTPRLARGQPKTPLSLHAACRRGAAELAWGESQVIEPSQRDVLEDAVRSFQTKSGRASGWGPGGWDGEAGRR